MKPVTIGGVDCYLIAGSEVWGGGISAEFATKSAGDAGLSNREGRRAFAAETIAALSFRIFLEGVEAAEFRAGLRAYANEPILVPFWPADCLLSALASCRWLGGLRLFYEADWSFWEVRAGATAPSLFVPTGSCRVVPLAWCRFDKLPAPVAADGDEAMEVDIAAIENGAAAYAIKPTGVTVGSGPAIGALTPKLLSILPDWDAGVTGGAIELRVAREQIGYGRAESESYVEQLARGRQKFTLPPTDDEIAQLVSLFRECGAVGTFWVPGAFAETRLAEPVTSGAIVTVEDGDALADLAYVALVGDTIAARQLVSRDGAAVTLSSPPGPFPAGTAVRTLMLARFASTKLKVTWATPVLAAASVEFVEMPTETSLPAGETVGATIGALPALWWGYVVTDGVNTWRFTNYESAIAAGGTLGTFEPRPIDHGDITLELNLERHDVDLTIGKWDGSPFERARTDRLAPPLNVQIYKGNISAPSAAAVIFTGKVDSYQFEGEKCTCKLAGPTAIFDTKGPLCVTSQRCWVPLFSPLCTVSEAAKQAAAELTEIDGGTGALSFRLPGGDPWPATAADHYRFGYAERTAADGSPRRFRVSGSEVADGTGDLVLHVQGSVAAAASYPEPDWRLVPGCDKSWARCKVLGGKFRGFPRMPKSNPALIPVKQQTPSGSKK